MQTERGKCLAQVCTESKHLLQQPDKGVEVLLIVSDG